LSAGIGILERGYVLIIDRVEGYDLVRDLVEGADGFSLPGVPRITTIGLFPMQIVQTPTTIVMLYEVFSVFRVIPLNAKHPEDLEPSYMGDSVGHWEGDTLVVDVTSFNDKTWLGPVGSFHSEALHVTERYTRTDYNTIQ
jgi:hypothetical protein